jgi:hypothetical protein
MRGDFHKEPPLDIEFPYFEVVYYDQPESVGITINATDGRSKRWPDCSQTMESDGSINIWEPADDGAQHTWRQKLGEFLTDRFLLVDPKLKGMIWFAPPLFTRAHIGFLCMQCISSR